MDIGSNGDVLVSNEGRRKIQKINLTTLAVSNVKFGLNRPYMVILNDGTTVNNYNSGDPIPVNVTQTTAFGIQTVIDANDCPHSEIRGTATIYLMNPNDDIPPLAICQDVSVALDDYGMASIAITDVDNNSFDNLGQPIASFDLDQTDFVCSNGNSIIITLTVTDLSGNSAQCTSTVTVTDPTNSCCPSQVNVSHPPTDLKVYKADQLITSDGSVRDADGSTNIKFKAGQTIDLNPGFEVELNTIFEAIIDPCNWPE